jgi:tRNA G18 (ribose-2'-O)-methylase SpoU
MRAERIIRVERADDPQVADYVDVQEASLARRAGAFIAEGTELVRTMIHRSRHPVRSVLVSEKRLEAMREDLGLLDARVPIYVAAQPVMNAIAGFDIHRGCLAIGERSAIPGADELLASIEDPGGSVLIVLEGLANHDNLGGVFRNAAAFGARAVLLDPTCADPLYRKAIRVSMGAALTVPFARLSPWPDALAVLRDRGYRVAALTPAPDAEDLRRAPIEGSRWALLLGTEGVGLTPAALARADRRWRIAIEPVVDSLNVATAAGIALFALSRSRG